MRLMPSFTIALGLFAYFQVGCPCAIQAASSPETTSMRSSVVVAEYAPPSQPAVAADEIAPAGFATKARLTKSRQRGRRYNRNSSIEGSAGSSLPSGRRYYNGRYFGNLNNRFYGPQYGYF